MVNYKLNLLHSKDQLNARLGIDAEAHIYALHVVVAVSLAL